MNIFDPFALPDGATDDHDDIIDEGVDVDNGEKNLADSYVDRCVQSSYHDETGCNERWSVIDPSDARRTIEHCCIRLNEHLDSSDKTIGCICICGATKSVVSRTAQMLSDPSAILPPDISAGGAS